MRQEQILIVGGAGFIGSHVNALLARAGYSTIILDNLNRGHRNAVINGTFIEGDLANTELLNTIFSTYSIQAVMHFAALADVGESVRDPWRYYRNNVTYTLNLLEAMQRHHVKAFIFSSSATIFGIPKTARIAEDHECKPINPYGHTKLMVETILQDYDHAFGLRSCCLRYFNAAGGDSHGAIKYFPRVEFNIIPRVLLCAQEPARTFTIYGTDYSTPDGTCIRDYIHVEDLASAHISALERLLDGAPSSQYNLGNGKGFSVREVVAAIEEVTGKKVAIEEGPRRLGDPPTLVSDATKAERELGWRPRYAALEDMVLHAWNARS